MSKKERTIIKVDEDKIKRMIAGEEPYGQETAEEESGPQQPDAGLNAKAPVPASGKRPARNSYEDIFLKTVRTNDRKQTSIQLSEPVFRKMEILLKTTRGLSMGLFINNVLVHHFEKYEDDIIAVREKFITKLSEDV